MAKVQATFAANLKRYRQAAGLSQEELADAAELSVGVVTRAEQGRGVPNQNGIAKLAEVLRIEETDLFYPGEPPKPQILERKVTLREALRVVVAALAEGERPNPILTEYALEILQEQKKKKE
jgi:transcriptional regulator with XRE-family HTH domain